MSFDFDYWAIWSYNRLRLLQPHIPEEGLFKLGERYFIHCPGLNAAMKSREGELIDKWFKDNKHMITPIELAPEKPTGATRIRKLTNVELAACTGTSHTIRDIYSDLSVELPSSFPNFAINDGTGSITVIVSKNLSEDEATRLREVMGRLKLAVTWTVKVDPNLGSDDGFERSAQGDLDILPARSAAARGYGRELTELVRQDEERWLANRSQLARSGLDKSSLPNAFSGEDARCLINAATFPVDDIRNHLSIYQKVAIIAPLGSKAKQFYASANLTEDELVKLAEMGRVEVVCPQAVDRYPIRLLEKLSATAPASLVLSRSLALATVVDSRQRIPLLYPNLSMRDRATLLRSLLNATAVMKEEGQRKMTEAFLLDLGRIWNSAEELLHRRGAMANSALGIALPTSEFFSASGLPSKAIEFVSAAMSVEWAAAMRAAVQPIQRDTFTDRPYIEILATLYSGLRRDGFPRCEASTNVQVDEVLSVGRDVPIIDFAKSFTGGDIDRFRSCIRRISGHQYDEDETRSAAASFNAEVQRYASDAQRIERWDLIGLILVGGGSLNPTAATGAAAISLGVWALSRIKTLIEEGKIKNPEIVRWTDQLSAMLYSNSPDAVLVNRLKRRLKK